MGDSNGPLIGKIRDCGMYLQTAGGSGLDGKTAERLNNVLKEVCEEGMVLFEAGGALHNMLKGLKELLENENSAKHLAKGVSDEKVAEAFRYMTGSRPFS